MPRYTYTGDEDRYYSTLALTPEPDGEYDLDRNPGDGRWTPEDPEPEPEPVAEDVQEAADPEPPAAEPDTAPAQAPARTRRRTATTKEA